MIMEDKNDSVTRELYREISEENFERLYRLEGVLTYYHRRTVKLVVKASNESVSTLVYCQNKNMIIPWVKAEF